MSFANNLMDSDFDSKTSEAPGQSADVEPADIGWQALAPAIVCTVLATVVVAVRCYTRCRIVHRLGADDCVILLSLALTWAMCCVIGVEVYEGVGQYGRPVDSVAIGKLVLANNCIYTVAVNVTKASILTQYHRIFSGRNIRAYASFLMLLLLPAACWGVFGGIFLCRPVAKLWRPELPGHCINPATYWLSAASANIVLDFCVLILPMPSIASLHLPRKQKISLVLVFVLGFFVCVVSVVRLAVVDATAARHDYTSSGVNAILWSAVEANIGIVCASLMALKPFLTRLFPKLMDEAEIPKHSMRLPRIQQEEQVCSPTDSDQATLVSPRSRKGSSPVTNGWKEKYTALSSRPYNSVPARPAPAVVLTPPSPPADMSFSDMLSSAEPDVLLGQAHCGWPCGEALFKRSPGSCR